MSLTKIPDEMLQSGGGGGEVNTASNVGGGSGVFKKKTGVDLEFKSLVAGANILMTPSSDTISISVDGISPNELDEAAAQTTFITSPSGHKFALFSGYPKTKLANTSLAGACSKCYFSPNGKYLAVQHSTAPFVSVFLIDYASGSLTKLSDPSPAFSDTAQMIWSPDSKCLIQTGLSSFFIYKFDDLELTITRTATVNYPQANSSWDGSAITPDSKRIVINHPLATAPNVNIVSYSLDTTAGTGAFSQNISTVLRSTTEHVAIHPINGSLVVQNNSVLGALDFYTYDNVTNSFTFSFTYVLINSGGFPQQTARCMFWNKQGTYLAICGGSENFILSVDFSTNTVTKLSPSAAVPTLSANWMAWHPNGEYLVFACGGANPPYDARYVISSPTTYTATVSQLSGVSGNSSLGVDFSPNGRLMAFAQYSSPNAIQLYRIAGTPRIYSLLEGG